MTATPRNRGRDKELMDSENDKLRRQLQQEYNDNLRKRAIEEEKQKIIEGKIPYYLGEKSICNYMAMPKDFVGLTDKDYKIHGKLRYPTYLCPSSKTGTATTECTFKELVPFFIKAVFTDVQIERIVKAILDKNMNLLLPIQWQQARNKGKGKRYYPIYYMKNITQEEYDRPRELITSLYTKDDIVTFIKGYP